MNKKSIILGALFLSLFAQGAGHNDFYQINDKREFFVDDFLVDTLNGTRFKLHHPVECEPVLFFDNPWERDFSTYVTVLKDDSLFRMYYRGGTDKGMNTTCYAESKDGIKWKKPDLGLIRIEESLENNVIRMDEGNISHNFSPFIDSREEVPDSERYKAIGGKNENGLFALISEDGINWKKKWEKPIITEGAFDSQNVAFWSQSEEKYVCYFRTWKEVSDNRKLRSVSRTTSSDFRHWKSPREMVYPNFDKEHIYTNQTFSYFRAPHIYIALATRFVPGCRSISRKEADSIKVHPRYVDECSDVVLMSSRGGNKYDRLFLESFIRPGIGPENWVSRTNFSALNVVQTSPIEMSLYVTHNYAQPTAHLRRYTLRIDGFTSVNAGYEEGEMITIPLVFKGSDLFINYATSAAGNLRVELLYENNEPIEGFTLEDCKKMVGNRIKQRVSWRNNADLGEIEGQVVRLRFVMKDADLYSLKFE